MAFLLKQRYTLETEYMKIMFAEYKGTGRIGNNKKSVFVNDAALGSCNCLQAPAGYCSLCFWHVSLYKIYSDFRRRKLFMAIFWSMCSFYMGIANKKYLPGK